MCTVLVSACQSEVGPPEQLSFEQQLPAIKKVVVFAFRRVRHPLHEDLVAEAIGRAYVAFVRLIERGLAAVVYPTALGQFAVRQVCEGRRLGSRRTSNDLMSEYAQQKRGIVPHPLDAQPSQLWTQSFLLDRRASPAELVASKLDFAAWLQQLDNMKREAALALAMGDTTGEVAARFCVSFASVSQIRRELQRNWHDFQSDSNGGPRARIAID